jgi:hypothetical protein
MAFKNVENNGNWLPGGTYTYYVRAIYQTGCYYWPLIFEYHIIENGFLNREQNTATGLAYEYANYVGKGFLFTKENYDEYFDIDNFEYTRYANGSLSFEDLTVSGPVITEVEVVDEKIRDPWSGNLITWTQEYLLGIWLKITVTIPEDLPDGDYYIIAMKAGVKNHRGASQLVYKRDLNRKFSLTDNLNILPYHIKIGEDYWTSVYVPYGGPEYTLTWVDISDIERLNISISPVTIKGAPLNEPQSYVDSGGLTRMMKLAVGKAKKNMSHQVFGKNNFGRVH